MQIYYLIKHIPGIQPAENAEQYLVDEFELNHAILESLFRIEQFLSNVTFDERGMIEQLQRRETRNGQVYYSFVDNYVDPITMQEVHYEIVKKLISQAHVYEIRFVSRIRNVNRNCRILFTVNKSKLYLILTHGFTKTVNDDFKFMNQLTNRLAQIAELIFKNINNRNNDVEYIGKGGNRHEFQVRFN